MGIKQRGIYFAVSCVGGPWMNVVTCIPEQSVWISNVSSTHPGGVHTCTQSCLLVIGSHRRMHVDTRSEQPLVAGFLHWIKQEQG